MESTKYKSNLRSKFSHLRKLGSFVCLALIFSCEIEDDFLKADRSEFYGEKVYTSPYPLSSILWSDETNEIISLFDQGVIAINPLTQATRQLSVTTDFSGSDHAWLVKHMLYFSTFSGTLSSIDLNSMTIKTSLVDSIYFLETFSAPINSSYFAYSKFRASDVDFPSIFLYDLATGKEIYLTNGEPFLFSPEGQNLLYLLNDAFYSFDLQSKTILNRNFSGGYGSKIIKWTSSGILSYSMENENVKVTNESSNEIVARLPSKNYLFPGMVGNSGNHIIISKYKCEYNLSVNCPSMKVVYGIADIQTETDTELTYGYDMDAPKILSPDEKSIATIIKATEIHVATSPN